MMLDLLLTYSEALRNIDVKNNSFDPCLLNIMEILQIGVAKSQTRLSD